MFMLIMQIRGGQRSFPPYITSFDANLKRNVYFFEIFKSSSELWTQIKFFN